MKSGPFDLFVERKEVIEAFDQFVTRESYCRILLVSGLSGTGKSFLIDWLRSQRCPGIRTAKLTLSPSFQETDFLRSLAIQLDPGVGQEFARKLDDLTKKEQEHPLVNAPVTQRAEGRLGGSVTDTHQSVTVNVGDAAAAAIDLQRRIQRMDALMSSISSIDANPWVLFLDETEHLVQPDLKRFVLDELVPRLRVQSSNCRLYFSGQSVPVEAFPRHEVQRLQLSEFTKSETAVITKLAGLDDPKQSSMLYEQTGGHPLLVSMWVEDAMDRSGETGKIQFEDASAAGDEGERTRWIYDRIVSRFSDAVARQVAANLSLLEWFDLGLLRSIFDPAFSEAAFRQMVSRSFIKPLGGNRWRCHDIVRKHLPAQRRALNPEEYLEVCRHASQAYLSRMSVEEERTGIREFPERLSYVTAAMQSFLGFSAKSAEEFMLRELAHATTGSTDYLFALARYLESLPDGAQFSSLVRDIRDFLESIGSLRVNAVSMDFLERLATFSSEHEDIAVAAELFRFAALTSMVSGNLERATKLANQGYEIDQGTRGAVLLARCIARAGDVARAGEIINAARLRNGDSEELRMGEVRLALDRDDGKQAVRLLTELMTVYPDSSVAALLQLAELSIRENDLVGALKQLEALLQRDPGHVPALRLKVDVLFAQGKIAESLALISSLSDVIGDSLAASIRLVGEISQPNVRNRIVAQFKDDPKSVNPAVLLIVVDTLALEGQIKEVEGLAASVEKTWPETSEILQIKRSLASLRARRPEMVPALLEPLADRGVRNLDLYSVLADAYGALGKPQDQRKTLELGMDRVQGHRDTLQSSLVSAIARNEGVKAALQYLESQDATGPITLMERGRLLKEDDRLMQLSISSINSFTLRTWIHCLSRCWFRRVFFTPPWLRRGTSPRHWKSWTTPVELFPTIRWQLPSLRNCLPASEMNRGCAGP